MTRPTGQGVPPQPRTLTGAAVAVAFALALLSCGGSKSSDPFTITGVGWVEENIEPSYFKTPPSTGTTAFYNFWIYYAEDIAYSDIASARVYIPNTNGGYWNIVYDASLFDATHKFIGGWGRWWDWDSVGCLPIGSMRVEVELVDGRVGTYTLDVPAPASLAAGPYTSMHTEEMVNPPPSSAPMIRRATLDPSSAISTATQELTFGFSVVDANVYDGYVWLYDAQDNYLGISRFFRDPATGAIGPQLDGLTLRVDGTLNRVTLHPGDISLVAGAAFDEIAQFRVVLTDGAQYGLQAPGILRRDCVSISAAGSFIATGSSVPPAIQSIVPASAVAGGLGFLLTVTGSGFQAGSVVEWNGSPRPTVFVSGGELTASISAADIASAGAVSITVADPGGSASGPVTFVVGGVAPWLFSMSPNSAPAGAPGFALTVLGADFVPGSVVEWNGSLRPTTFVTDGELTAAISAADVASPGTVSVTVLSPGGLASSAQTFVVGIAPAIQSMSPASALAGAPGFTLTVLGSGFNANAVVGWNGLMRPTTFVSANSVRADISAADITAAGTASVTVTNLGVLGLPSSALTFTVTEVPAVPIVSFLSPASAPAGGVPFTLTVVGSGFAPQSLVDWNGSARATTYVSPSELHAQIAAADVAVVGSTTVSVYTPPPGGGSSSGVIFPITAPAATPTQAVAFHIGPSHSGYASFGQSLTFPTTPAWSVNLPGPVSYPVIADGRIFVLTAGSATGGNGAQLFALDEGTGQTLWGPVALPGTSFAGHTYENGAVFVVNGEGVFWSFDAATGTEGWTTQLPKYYSVTAPPTAANGIVYAGGVGEGGRVFAVEESSGTFLWSAAVEGGNSSPTISIDGVFVSYPCQVYKLDLATGSLLWEYNGGCDGGGGMTAAYANGSLYVRDSTSTPPGMIFDAESGSSIGSFPAPGVPQIPAFSPTAAFFLNNGALEEMDLAASAASWSFTGDGGLVSAPIVIDETVFVASRSGTVYAVDAVTGQEVWSGSAGAAVSPTDERNAGVPPTGLAAGEGFLVVPAGSTLTAWRLIGR